MYSNANRDENVELLMKLLDNQSKVTIDETTLRSNWLAKPETLGDVAIIQILNLMQKKVKIYNLSERDNINDKTGIKNPHAESMLITVENTNLIEKLLELLDSPSNTKKDVSVLILCTLSACRVLLRLMMNKDFLQRLINHVNSFKKLSILLIY